MLRKMSEQGYDCVSCGACCFSRNPNYLVLLPWDISRTLPADSVFSANGQSYVRFDCGYCVHLDLSEGRAVCGVYEDRPEACRAFRAGSFECIKARRANGIMGEKVRVPVAPLPVSVMFDQLEDTAQLFPTMDGSVSSPSAGSS